MTDVGNVILKVIGCLSCGTHKIIEVKFVFVVSIIYLCSKTNRLI